MEQFFLPVLSHFQNENFWTASDRRMRYLVTPKDSETLEAQVWEGPWGHAFSQIEEITSFPLSEEGLAQLKDWCVRWSETINARPPRSLEETIAMRDAALQAKASQSTDAES